MEYRFCGKSGLKLPLISLGLWHNFGDIDSYDTAVRMILTAFDKGITHFDIANNYGPPPGSAEICFGKILREKLSSHRDQMIISSKAGYLMWSGPYGDGGSRKYLIASIDQSLKRTGLDYFDIFYSHRYDPYTPIEETMQALVDIVRQGKALYAGISNYPAEPARKACKYLADNNTPCLVFQDKYSMLVRDIEDEKLDIADENGSGMIAFSPLAQGLLTKKYLSGIPENSRAAKPSGFLQREQVTPHVIEIVRRLNDMAQDRGQSLAQTALAWTLRNPKVTSSLIGAGSLEQLNDNIDSVKNLSFDDDELKIIDNILNLPENR